MNISLSAFALDNLVSRHVFGSPVPHQPAHLHTQAESGAYRTYGIPPEFRGGPLIYIKPPYAIESVPSLSGHAMAYRWRSLPRVRRHRASKPQGSSERMLTLAVYCTSCCCFSHSAHWLPTRKKLLYTVANPARGLLNREKKEKVWQRTPPPPPPARAARSEKK